MAARAHDVAALALRGRMACLNFADSATILPVPASSDIKDIQRAAAEAAEAFRPHEAEEENTGKEEEERVSMLGEMSSEGRRRKEYQEVMQESNAGSYMDDEATYQMPNLLTHMAEGMLMSPPPHTMYESFGWDEVETECEVSLWSYSI